MELCSQSLYLSWQLVIFLQDRLKNIYWMANYEALCMNNEPKNNKRESYHPLSNTKEESLLIVGNNLFSNFKMEDTFHEDD